MSWFMVDVEADGPIPGDYSMIEIGAVLVNVASGDLSRRFSANLRPVTDRFLPAALAVTGYTREQTLGFDEPGPVVARFAAWVDANNTGKPPVFVSDNNGFDWMFVCWYLHHYLGRNPFGFSSVNLGSVYKGIERNMYASFKHLRRTPHSHKSVEDALGNAEAFLTIVREHGVKT